MLVDDAHQRYTNNYYRRTGDQLMGVWLAEGSRVHINEGREYRTPGMLRVLCHRKVMWLWSDHAMVWNNSFFFWRWKIDTSFQDIFEDSAQTPMYSAHSCSNTPNYTKRSGWSIFEFLASNFLNSYHTRHILCSIYTLFPSSCTLDFIQTHSESIQDGVNPLYRSKDFRSLSVLGGYFIQFTVLWGNHLSAIRSSEVVHISEVLVLWKSQSGACALSAIIYKLATP